MRRIELPQPELTRRYLAGESTYALGPAYGVSQATARRWLLAAGVKLRPRGGPPGNKNGQHRPGGPLCTNAQGYLRTADREGKRSLIHRGCWEANNGPIPDGHIVHHRNEDRADYRIENLACMTRSEHTGLHNTVKSGGV